MSRVFGAILGAAFAALSFCAHAELEYKPGVVTGCASGYTTAATCQPVCEAVLAYLLANGDPGPIEARYWKPGGWWGCYMGPPGSYYQSTPREGAMATYSCDAGWTRDPAKDGADPQLCSREKPAPTCSDTAGEVVVQSVVCQHYFCPSVMTETAPGVWACPNVMIIDVAPPAVINIGGCKAFVGGVLDTTNDIATEPSAQSGSLYCQVQYATSDQPADGSEGGGGGPETPPAINPDTPPVTPGGAGNSPGAGGGGGAGGDGSEPGGSPGGGLECTPDREKLGLCTSDTGGPGNGGQPGNGQETNCTPAMQTAGQCNSAATYTAPTDCGAPPVCAGDPILCGLGKQHWQAACALVEVTADDRLTFEAAITKEQSLVKTGVESYNAKAEGLVNNFETAVTSRLGSGATWCPSDVVVQVYGRALVFPFGRAEVCDVFKLFRLFVMLAAYVQAIRIVLGGIK